MGATGGSGTRVFARIARCGGMFIGSQLAPSEDALPFRPFFERWTNAYMDQTERWNRPAAALEELMLRDLDAVLAEHCPGGQARHASWGWKAPRSIYLLPFWRRAFPGMRFLHIVRDGRDIAFSANQNQVRRHGGVLLEPGEEGASLPLRAMLLWSRLNLLAAQFGERWLGDAYLAMRYEDLCREPRRTIERMLAFLGLEADGARIAASEVRPPASLGRWRDQPAALIAAIESAGAAGLRRFGYQASSRAPEKESPCV
jgi:hypothetical protein